MHRNATALLCGIALSALATWGVAAESADEETARLGGLAMDRFLEGQARVMRIADRIRLAGTPFCDKSIARVIGVFPADERTFRDMIPGDEAPHKQLLVDAAQEKFALGKQPKVLLVVPDLAGDRGGLVSGDIVTRIDGKKLSRRDRLETLKKKGEDGTFTITVERDGAPIDLELEVEIGCAYPSRFWYGTSINAFSAQYGKLTGIYVVGGMLHFLPSDDDLAIVLGHELAHLILGHSGGVTTERTEAEADYLGMYLAARAGYDVSGAMELWDEMTRRNPYSSIDWGFYGHPISPKRSLELRSALDEIEAKIASRQPLEPERRP